ncbi:MAG: tetratricopeptide repeat protein [Bryobacteraceae bacterium]
MKTLLFLLLMGQETATDAIQKAAAAMQAQRWEECRRFAEQALKLDPKSGDAETLLGLTDTAGSRFEQAERHFARATSLQPGNYRAHSYWGSTLLQLGRFAEGKQQFERVLQLNPGNAAAHYNLGVIALAQQKPLDGRAQFEAVLKAAPSDAAALLGLMECQLRLRQRGEVLASAKRLVTVVDGRSPDLARAAKLLSSFRAYEAQVVVLEKMRAAMPDSPETAYNLALGYFEADRFGEAAALLRRSAGEQADAWNLLGRAEERGKRLPEALAAYRRAVELKPQVEDYEFDYECALLASGDLATAKTRSSAGARSLRQLLVSGVISYLSGDHEAAAAAFLTAVEMAPQNQLTYYLLGRAYESAGAAQPRIAAVFARYLAKDPPDAWAHLSYGKILGSEPHVRRALAIDPSLAEAHVEMAVLAQEQQRYAASLSHLEKAATLAPTLSEIYYRLGTAYQRIGDEAKAKTAFDRFRKAKADATAAERTQLIDSLARAR